MRLSSLLDVPDCMIGIFAMTDADPRCFDPNWRRGAAPAPLRALGLTFALALALGMTPAVAADRLDARELGVAYARCLATVANRPAIAGAPGGDVVARHQAAKGYCQRLRQAFSRRTAAEFRPQPDEIANSIEGRVLNALR